MNATQRQKITTLGDQDNLCNHIHRQGDKFCRTNFSTLGVLEKVLTTMFLIAPKMLLLLTSFATITTAFDSVYNPKKGKYFPTLFSSSAVMQFPSFSRAF